jgi:hypothetical protein
MSVSTYPPSSNKRVKAIINPPVAIHRIDSGFGVTIFLIIRYLESIVSAIEKNELCVKRGVKYLDSRFRGNDRRKVLK